MSQRGRLTSPQQPFKPLTQPAPHPVCSSPDRADSFLQALRSLCKCIRLRVGGKLGWSLTGALTGLQAELGEGSWSWGSPPSQSACISNLQMGKWS